MSPELQTEWENQVNKLLKLGFNDEIHKSETTYKRLMPQFAPQPETYQGRFDLPLLVDPRIPLNKQLKIAGVHNILDEASIADIIKPPDQPYTLWTHDGNRYRKFSVKEAVGQFQTDEIGCSLIEVIAFYLHYPEIFADHGIDAAGSTYGANNVPCLHTLFGKPELSHGELDHPDSRWGTLSRGRKIETAVQSISANI